LQTNTETPRWVPALIAVMALLPLANYAALVLLPPEGRVPSGLHTVDTYCYVTPMQYMPEGFATPYARVGNDGAMPAGAQYYGMPYHFLYGALGVLNLPLGLPPLLLLALAQGAGFALLLWGVWRLFGTLLPEVRDTAFLLAAIGGGIGGVVGFVAVVSGWSSDPVFPEAFGRWFVYDLVEGARGNLHLLHNRLYYTLPLALAILGWAGIVKDEDAWVEPRPTGTNRSERHTTSSLRGASLRATRQPLLLLRPALLLALATLINFRIGPMVWAAALLPVATGHVPRCPRRIAVWTLGMAAGLVLALIIASRNPSHVSSSLAITRESIGLAAWAASAGLLLPPALAAIGRVLRAAQGWTRYALWAGAGYLGSFAALYVVIHLYFGNYLLPLDFAAAVAVSDWALAGIPLGLATARVLRPSSQEDSPPAWLALWLLGALGIGVSAWGSGWFIQFAPQRLLVLCGLPLAALAAYGLHGWSTAPRRAYLAATVAAGVLGIAFAWGVSHGPFFDTQARALLPWTRFAYLSEADSEAIALLEDGVVLTPSLGAPLYGDVIAAHSRCSVVYGNGTLDFSGEDMSAVRRAVSDFYAPSASESDRRALLDSWRVRYILCPELAPVDPATRAALRAWPGARMVYESGEVLLLDLQRGD